MPSRLYARSLLCLTAVLAIASPGTATARTHQQEVPDLIHGKVSAPSVLDDLLSKQKADGLPELPLNPNEALIDITTKFSRALGVEQDATETITRAQLSPRISGRMALALQALLVCHQVTTDALSGLSEAELLLLAAGDRPPSASLVDGLTACAPQVVDSALELKAAFATQEPGGDGCTSSIHVWPIFHAKCHGGGAEIRNDYVLIVDNAGGDDLYFNNAGGNLLDVTHDPATGEPAVGCQWIPDLTAGKCVPSAAMVLDLEGNDTYGELETPDVDATLNCTSDMVVRRIVLQGSGFAGVGVLIDDSGDDTYLGKTIAQGSGHIGGIGILRDPEGVNTYTAIRNSQGFGLAAGLGLLQQGHTAQHDYAEGHFDYYMPEGGVVSDTGQCDSVPRHMQGAGVLGGAGALISLLSSSDSYRSPATGQGFGTSGGAGIFVDWMHMGTYEGVPGRGPHTEVLPSASNTGYFSDMGFVGP